MNKSATTMALILTLLAIILTLLVFNVATFGSLWIASMAVTVIALIFSVIAAIRASNRKFEIVFVIINAITLAITASPLLLA